MLLDVRNLTVKLNSTNLTINAIDKMSLSMRDGSIHGLVGETGSGKSLFAKALIGTLSDKWTVQADRMFWQGEDLLKLSTDKRRQIINRDMAMIFQEPSRSLDPTVTIGEQINEVIPKSEFQGSIFSRRQERLQIAKNLLIRVGIKHYQQCYDSYPHELSEGLCQKVMIAMAIIRSPKLLIADEPTDAMESTTKIQIMRLLQKLNTQKNMSVLLITHDLESVINYAEEMTLLYSGQSVESGAVKELLKRPYHPYTQNLFKSIPKFNTDTRPKSRLETLPGSTPPLQHLPIGCRLGPRCPRAQKECVYTPKSVKLKGHVFSCHHPINLE
ncbi:ATP-binding cassette domain-containing protein [Catenovulum sp. 2E275]|uniref:oligopeptide/dipeptide ABC transporter ATP-binding protein n=1 Tax=Catenovulum sp. 2E275 TaxID=2980497 RepID=UPI0021D097AE|nr:oligopeptide/dipeptide ABC transporter ATP-binding protein [Catenovulum sp. 2E275]MCU4676740.1 ATP-binding cassette domain-containing protein [Catenovulum sp. 2E275]